MSLLFRQYFRLRILGAGLCLGLTVACATNSRIIRQSPTAAIIAGEGDSRIEAELTASDLAAEIFPEYHQTREMECSQEHRGNSDTQLYPAAGHLSYGGRSYSYWQCVFFIAPGPGMKEP